ncbi:MAG: DMT family transporter [Tabrizicola sp.]|nr:DMT family transporter [Tabrizicola sp.]
MIARPFLSPGLTGSLCALAGSAILSINDMAIKALSGTYALHQVILVRALIGLVFLLALMTVLRTPFHVLLTARPRGHLLRVGFVLMSNLTYFLGLAAMPLADAVAIAFVSPLLVTLLSVLVLGEHVGPRRWIAVATGMLGVAIIYRPATEVFQPAAVLILISALCYAATHMMTRHMKATESAFTLSFYVQIGFVLLSAAMGLAVGDGHLGGSGNPSLDFLFRGWVWPAPSDWPAFLATGLSVTIGGLLVAQAYRLGEAALIAPFEYAALPMAVIWGLAVFGTFPDLFGWIGIALICGSGLYTIWRETLRRGEMPDDTEGRGS